MSHTASDVLAGTNSLLRNEPVQARSTARLTSLLDAAAAVVDEIGYERLTTAMVADRAGSSIGTVYRYFPDRIAVLHAMSARSLARFDAEGALKVNAESHANWLDAMTAVFQYWLDAFRVEPGFRSLRFGDVIDLRPPAGARANNSIVAESVVGVIETRNWLPGVEDLQFHVETSLELCDALLSRAFTFDAQGDQKFIDGAFTIPTDYLVSVFGRPATR